MSNKEILENIDFSKKIQKGDEYLLKIDWSC